MTESNDLNNTLARASEGVALAMKNRNQPAEARANIEYAQANLRHALDLLGEAR